MGCGYGFQNSKNPLYLKEGVSKIYVAPLINDTFKVGVESILYNSLIRAFATYKRVQVVHFSEDADAILQGRVTAAGYTGTASASVPQLNPVGLGSNIASSGLFAAVEYTANLVCTFSLTRRKVIPGKNTVIWSLTFNRSKFFPGANQLDVLGTTSSLINESEFERALSDISRSMMDDLHESMLAMF